VTLYEECKYRDDLWCLFSACPIGVLMGLGCSAVAEIGDSWNLKLRVRFIYPLI